MAVVAQRGAAPSDFLETEPFLGSDYKTADIVSISRERERTFGFRVYSLDLE